MIQQILCSRNYLFSLVEFYSWLIANSFRIYKQYLIYLRYLNISGFFVMFLIPN